MWESMCVGEWRACVEGGCWVVGDGGERGNKNYFIFDSLGHLG